MEKGVRAICRFCGSELKRTLIDLGAAPLSNSYVAETQLNHGEVAYPLHVYVCTECFLVQLEEFKSPEGIFSDYAYFSSYSNSWLEHAKNYTDMMIARFGFHVKSFVVEAASNDGYLLQYFKQNNIPVLGIEPAKNVAQVSREKGIETIACFFGTDLAERLRKDSRQADLFIGNNVMAHVPDINDFIQGIKILLKADGVCTVEFPHLLNLIKKVQFDTIYHEHFSYLSFATVKRMFEAHGLKVFDVEKWETHGGSLRVFACHDTCGKYKAGDRVASLITEEDGAGLHDIKVYQDFARQVHKVKFDLLDLLIRLKRQGKKIAAYGAPAKGNTLLNYCGIGTEFIAYTVDKNPYKQNCYLPGSRIPVFAPEKLAETKPDYILILPWNLQDEILEQLSYVREWGAKFILPVPAARIIE